MAQLNQNKTAAAPTVNPAYIFFQKMKSKIQWLEVKDFKVTHSMIGDTPAQMYEKTILGTTTGNVTNKPDYVVSVNFVCTIGKDASDQGEVNEQESTIILKSYSTNTRIMAWIVKRQSYGSKADMAFAINTIYKELGLSGKNIESPNEFYQRGQADIDSLPPMDIHGKEGYYYHRLTRNRTNMYEAAVMEFYILKHKSGYTPIFTVDYLERNKKSGERAFPQSPFQLGEAIQKIDKSVKACREQKGYVGPESPFYIPEGANMDNWDFTLNQWRQDAMRTEPNRFTGKSIPETPPEPTPVQQESQEPDPVQPIVVPRRKPMLDLKNLLGQRQDFGGYFEGEVPDYAGSLIGTPSVDASQIGGMFSGTNEAVSLVNSYTSDALKNVAYIFNFSKGGAYGVYIPALDRAIKTKALKKQLEAKGYKIVDENGVLTAHPTKKETTPEQIDQDINALWEQLNSQGGSALGINMADVLGATDQNTSDILNKIRQQVPDAPSQIEPILRDVLGVYHLAAIILHESSHAKGGDEGKAGSDEQSFRTWAQDYLNNQYQSKLSSAGLEDFYSPLELSTQVIHAATKSWYKTSQSIMGRLNYSPYSGSQQPKGSDLSGRHNGAQQGEGMADWAMLLQQDQNIPIEQRLDRSTKSPIERDVDPANDIIEEQLRKQFKNDSKPNVQLITEELLAPDRRESQGYKALETMLEELRPQPLMTPLQKAAMNTMKVVSWKAGDTGLFGWYNNLDLDDGSTIPGLSDRVMAWDDRDESFSAEEQTVKNQGRYNPSYDLKGFYSRWIEPRFKPQLFDDMTQDYSNTHPAKRFAATLDPSVTKMLSVIKLIEESIINEKIKATRIVASEGFVDVIKRLLDHEGIKLRAYKVSDSEDLFAIWAYGGMVSEDSLDKAEQYFQNIDGSEQYKDLMEELLNSRSSISSAVEEIVNEAKELCKEYDVEDLFAIGEYARKIYEGDASPYVTELDFTCEQVDAGLKIGSLLANKLNVPTERIILGKAGISFPYRGIRVFFSKSPYYSEIGNKMSEHGYNVEDPVLRDLCNRDFTINMLAYDVRDMKILDPIGVKTDVENKIAKTLFDASTIIGLNPMVIMRALALRLDGYRLDEDLERSAIENSSSLNDRFSPERLKFTREYVKSKGMNEADSLFQEYGLKECEEQI